MKKIRIILVSLVALCLNVFTVTSAYKRRPPTKRPAAKRYNIKKADTKIIAKPLATPKSKWYTSAPPIPKKLRPGPPPVAPRIKPEQAKPLPPKAPASSMWDQSHTLPEPPQKTIPPRLTPKSQDLEYTPTLFQKIKTKLSKAGAAIKKKLFGKEKDTRFRFPPKGPPPLPPTKTTSKFPPKGPPPLPPTKTTSKFPPKGPPPLPPTKTTPTKKKIKLPKLKEKIFENVKSANPGTVIDALASFNEKLLSKKGLTPIEKNSLMLKTLSETSSQIELRAQELQKQFKESSRNYQKINRASIRARDKAKEKIVQLQSMAKESKPEQAAIIQKQISEQEEIIRIAKEKEEKAHKELADIRNLKKDNAEILSTTNELEEKFTKTIEKQIERKKRREKRKREKESEKTFQQEPASAQEFLEQLPQKTKPPKTRLPKRFRQYTPQTESVTKSKPEQTAITQKQISEQEEMIRIAKEKSAKAIEKEVERKKRSEKGSEKIFQQESASAQEYLEPLPQKTSPLRKRAPRRFRRRTPQTESVTESMAGAA